MGEKRRKLDKGEIAEIKEFYDGTRTSVVYLAKLFEVSMGRILWLTDHKNFRKSRTASSAKWKKANMEAVKLINKKSSIKWINKNRKKLNIKRKKKYWENIEKSRKKSKDYYNKNKEKIQKINKIKYWENIEKSRKRARDYYNKNKERIRKIVKN